MQQFHATVSHDFVFILCCCINVYAFIPFTVHTLFLSFLFTALRNKYIQHTSNTVSNSKARNKSNNNNHHHSNSNYDNGCCPHHCLLWLIKKGKCYCQCRTHWQIEACKTIVSSGPNPNTNPNSSKNLRIYTNRQHYTSLSDNSINFSA